MPEPSADLDALGISSQDVEKIQRGLKQTLGEASRVLVFNARLQIIASTFTPNPSELEPLSTLPNDRDTAIRRGLVMGGVKYEVHRHHPPLVYGRTAVHDEGVEGAEGAALCRVDYGLDGQAMFAVISYGMPNVSARMVPLLQRFCDECLTRR